MTKQSMESGAAAAANAIVGAPVTETKESMGGRGAEATTTTTKEQARAIICMAKREVEEAAAKARGDGAAGEPSLKRSLQWFLEGRKNKATSCAASRRRVESSPAASSSSSN